MAYTFWHSGILIGESDLEDASDFPRHYHGVFRPTAYGLEVFPRLSGMLSAGHALKTHLDANGLSPETMERDAIDDLLDTTPAGQKILDIGRMLSDVEMRAPDGLRMEFASIGFMDLSEMQRLVHELELGAANDLANVQPEAPRYVVSATLRDSADTSGPETRAGHFRRRHWSEEN